MLQPDSKELYILLNVVFNGKRGKLYPNDLDLIETWIEAGVPLSEIIKAYGLMMKRCENPSFRYMAKIIENSIYYQEGKN